MKMLIFQIKTSSVIKRRKLYEFQYKYNQETNHISCIREQENFPETFKEQFLIYQIIKVRNKRFQHIEACSFLLLFLIKRHSIPLKTENQGCFTLFCSSW